ncbi:MAG: 1,2-phenylacetyl-CoA epoxidase subunit PaaD [Planctomycetota bacterium]|jgi:ring-1,2-phenylacetyl-CoA epoxidase subunit PaaD
MAVLTTVDDPEMPISIVDLGMVGEVRIVDAQAHIELLPTFIGCPALPMIAGEIDRKVTALDGIDAVEVAFIFDPPWSVDRISERGRVSLAAHGVTVPGMGDVPGVAVACPYCDISETEQTSAFGPTRCRSIWYCRSCGNSFEHMKRL